MKTSTGWHIPTIAYMAYVLSVVAAWFGHRIAESEFLRSYVYLGVFLSVGAAFPLIVVTVFNRLRSVRWEEWSPMNQRTMVFLSLPLATGLAAALHLGLGRTVNNIALGGEVRTGRFNDFFFTTVFLSFVVLGIVLLSRFVESYRSRTGPSIAERLRIPPLARLVIKQGLSACFILWIVSWTNYANWSRPIQYRLTRPDYHWEADPRVITVPVESFGLGHTQYLKIIHSICGDLAKAGAKVIVVPLPGTLARTDGQIDALRRISNLGNIVFAMSPELGPEIKNPGDLPLATVQHPTRRKAPVTWGVISAQAMENYGDADRYYPLTFTEEDTSVYVPDAALVAAGIFLGTDATHGARIDNRTLFLGTYRTGLREDQSAPVFMRYYPYSSRFPKAFVDPVTDSLSYYIWTTKYTGAFPNEMAPLVRGAIVTLEPGHQITGMLRYGWSATNQILQILDQSETHPLDRYSVAISFGAMMVVLLLLIALPSWLGPLVGFAFAFYQPFLYHWLAIHTGYLVEIVPPTLATFIAVILFAMIQAIHDRGILQRKERKRILEELQTAHDMQMGLMPADDPSVPGFDISGRCIPTYEVGGDYFDYIWLDEEKTKFGIALADVSGKAMKAAMTAVMTSGMVYREISSRESPRTILTRINRPLYLKTDRYTFTAMSFAVIDIHSKTLSFSNAGQMAPLIVRNGEVQTLKVEGARLPLGVQEVIEYGETSVQLASGDLLILFTDGLTETMNAHSELFGFDRLHSIAATCGGRTSKQVVDLIISEAQKFAGSADQHDDMTLVTLKVA